MNVARGALLGVIVAMLAVGGMRFGLADGGDGTVIHACVTSTSGSVKIVDHSDPCDSSEEPLHWPRVGQVNLKDKFPGAVSKISDLQKQAQAKMNEAKKQANDMDRLSEKTSKESLRKFKEKSAESMKKMIEALKKQKLAMITLMGKLK